MISPLHQSRSQPPGVDHHFSIMEFEGGEVCPSSVFVHWGPLQLKWSPLDKRTVAKHVLTVYCIQSTVIYQYTLSLSQYQCELVLVM